jgi:hypothetical protein
LNGKAIDKDHLRKATVGYWLDAELEDSDIIAYGAFWKSNFPEDYDIIKDRMVSGKMKISFEAWGERKFKEDGSYDLTDIEFAGGALLFDTEPAFPDAEVIEFSTNRVLEFAKIVEEKKDDLEEKEKAMQVENKLPEHMKPITENKTRTCSRCWAEFQPGGVSRYQTTDETMCPVCDWEVNELAETDEEKLKAVPSYRASIEGDELIDEDGTRIEDAKKLTYKERKQIDDDMFAVVKEKDGKKIRMFPIHDAAHIRNALARLSQATETLRKLGVSPETVKNKILKRARELNMTELLKRHEKGGNDVDELLKKYQKASVEEFDKFVAESVSSLTAKDTEIAALKAEKDTLIKSLDEAKLIVENSKLEVEKVKTEAANVKAELDKRLAAEKAAFIKARRDELGEEFAKDISDEDIVDDLKFENVKLKKEIAQLKTAKPAEGGLEAGAKTVTKDEKVFVTQKNIETKAFTK